tara:strand:+ start:536 stop:1141 length:606 start_codon:yes stop_codon:yes gene_type:complete
MPEFLTQNSKIKTTSKELGVRLFNFGIPAYQTAAGKRTCPFAGECVKFCYAQKGAYVWGNVKPAFEWRYEQTQLDTFVDQMNIEVRRKRADYVRVHDSGDYYSPKYLAKWFRIARENPGVRFYSYTNSVKMVKEADAPENFDFIFSDSGMQSNLIQPGDRHARIFGSLKELKDAGYADASKLDLMATKWFNESGRVGLIFH